MILVWLGCYDSPELTPEWQLDRLRSVAIVAEPAEPKPGDTVTFTSLTYVPAGAQVTSFWIACVDGEQDGCDVDSDLAESALSGEIDPSQMSPEEIEALVTEAEESGLIGVDPVYPPVWHTPVDALYEVTGWQLAEGLTGSVQVAFSAGDDLEIVVRRIPISFARTPNHNPVIESLVIDETPIPRDETGALVPVVVQRGGTININASVIGGPEDYEYLTTEGYLELRTEGLQWRFYTDIGSLGGGSLLDLFSETPKKEVGTAQWAAPASAAEGVLYVVVLDGRGGMGFEVLPLQVL